MKVTIKSDGTIKNFDNVTNIKCSMNSDMFKNTIKIYQKKNKTTIKQYKVDELEIKEDTCENEKNCKKCNYPCIHSGKNFKPITINDLKNIGYVLCEDYTEK